MEHAGLMELRELLGLQSERHLRRLVARLRADGVPIQERFIGGRKRLAIAPEHRRVRTRVVTLSEEGVLALAVAAQAARSALAVTPLGRPLESAFGALLRQMDTEVGSFAVDDERERWHFGSGGVAHIDPEVFGALARAIRECHGVFIDYTTASTGEQHVERPIDPYGLAARDGSWLCVAFCRRRQAIRDFSLAGITRVVPRDPDTDAGAIFTPPANFNMATYFAGRFNALHGGTPHVVRILVEPDRAIYFHRKRYHDSQRVIAEQPDGRLLVEFTVANLDEIRSFAQGWGVGVTVLEPPALVARMSAEARELAARYGASGDREALPK